jgi:hypothetical protein
MHQGVTVVLFCTACTLAAGMDGRPITAEAAGGGLKGEYFGASDAPVLTRIDSQIDFDWSGGPPGANVNAGYFRVYWTGFVKVASTDTYAFSVQACGSATLQVGQVGDGYPLLVDLWGRPPGIFQGQGSVQLTGGCLYPVRLYYSHSSSYGPASVRLSWQSSSLAFQPIPPEALQPPVWADDPLPADGLADVVQHPSLQWIAGCYSASHDVYLGTDANAVANATTASAGIYRGRQSLSQTPFSPGGLDWGRTYYWRVDEVNERDTNSPWKGPVWSFTTAADYIPVEDFEHYTSERGRGLLDTWIDGYPDPNYGNGTGAIIGYSGTDIVPVPHSGVESMPFSYDNTDPPYCSEVDRTWLVPQDWTENGMSELSLWFKGRAPPFVVKSDGNIVLSVSSNGSAWGQPPAYAYKGLHGDGEIAVKCESFVWDADCEPWAGIVIVENPSSVSSRYATLWLTADGTLRFQYVSVPNKTSTANVMAGVHPPHWLKLSRTGDKFVPQHSADGVTWQAVTDANGLPAAAVISMLPDTSVGLYVTSCFQTASIAEFSHVATTGTTSDWKPASSTDNSLDNFYVALQDSSGRIGTIVHPDPNAVDAALWTQWKIPLSQFTTTGVDVKSIQKMYIGVGDRDHPKPDGQGMIWIDDIRVSK